MIYAFNLLIIPVYTTKIRPEYMFVSVFMTDKKKVTTVKKNPVP